LVRRRYLELKRDYLKAIYNAPSDHFCTLYQENLEKIEEAYLLLTGSKDQVKHEIAVNETIAEIQNLVDNLQKNNTGISHKSRDLLERYIKQIEHLQEQFLADHLTDPSTSSTLSTRDSEGESTKLSSPGWKWEVKQKKQARPASTSEQGTQLSSRPSSILQENLNETTGIIDWLKQIFGKTQGTTSYGTRKQAFDQFLMTVILAVVVLSTIGIIYILFPLLF